MYSRGQHQKDATMDRKETAVMGNLAPSWLLLSTRSAHEDVQ